MNDCVRRTLIPLGASVEGDKKKQEGGNWEQRDSPNPQCKHEAAPRQQKQDASV